MIGILNHSTGVLGAIAMIFGVMSLLALVFGTRMRRRPSAYLVALGLVIVSALCARINVEVWFDLLKLDPQDEYAATLARRAAEKAGDLEATEANRKREEEAREAEAREAAEAKKGLAGTVRFAEDSAEDRLRGGAIPVRGWTNAPPPGEDTVKAVTNKLVLSAVTGVPAWREGGRKVRGGTTNLAGKAAGGTNLAAGAAGDTNGASEFAEAAERLKGESEVPVIYLKTAQLDLARGIEYWGRTLTNSLMFLILLAIVWDYTRAFNLPHNLRLPLPLSSFWIDDLSPKPRVLVIPPDPEEAWRPEAFLSRAVRKGEKVIYFGQKPIWEGKSALPKLYLPGLRKWCVPIPRLGDLWLPLPTMQLWHVPILRYADLQLPLPAGSEFVLDAVWFGRYVAIVTGDAPCRAIVRDFVDILGERHQSGAVSVRTLVIAWDRDEELDESVLSRLAKLSDDINLSVVIWSRGKEGREEFPLAKAETIG